MSLDQGVELTCKELVELVTDFLEGKLASAERIRFELHIAACDGCRVYLRQMRDTLRAVGRLSEEALTPGARQRLLAAFRRWRHRPGL